jgi:dienelactone hydrolase
VTPQAPDDGSAAPATLTPDSYLQVLAADSVRPYAFRATSPAELAAWQQAFRPHLRSLLGLDTIASRGIAALEDRLVTQEECQDHIREEWTIQSEPGLRVPFYVLRPPRIDRPLPVVLTPHGHGKAGKRTYVGLWQDDHEREEIVAGERDVALQAVRAGYVAIAPDLRGFAALRRQEDIAIDAVSSCRTWQLHALLLGRTLLGERVWDITRLIDYAATRPDVDARRIVITGNSGGGTVSLFAAACDERIAVAVPASYFCTFEHSIGSLHHCECNYVPGLLAAAEMYDVAGLIAPRPFLAVAGRNDPIFPYSAVQEAFARLHRVYEVAAVPERCALYTGEGGHRYYKAGVWPFVRRWLSGDAAA